MKKKNGLHRHFVLEKGPPSDPTSPWSLLLLLVLRIVVRLQGASSIINTYPPSREHIPRHSTQVPASFLLRFSTTSISSNSISTPVYSFFFFFPLSSLVLLPSLPGSRFHSSFPLSTIHLIFLPVTCDDALNVSSLSLSPFHLFLLAYTRY